MLSFNIETKQGQIVFYLNPHKPKFHETTASLFYHFFFLLTKESEL